MTQSATVKPAGIKTCSAPKQNSSAQQEILASGILTSGFNCILQMPTGSGKTWLAEQAIAHVLQQGKRAIYLTPLRALAEELTTRWQQRFSDEKVGVFSGDYAQSSYPVSFGDARLLVMTPEKLDACIRNWRSLTLKTSLSWLLSLKNWRQRILGSELLKLIVMFLFLSSQTEAYYDSARTHTCGRN